MIEQKDKTLFNQGDFIKKLQLIAVLFFTKALKLQN